MELLQPENGLLFVNNVDCMTILLRYNKIDTNELLTCIQGIDCS
jgi:hypothetical protein